jgi:hypothetical protein
MKHIRRLSSQIILVTAVSEASSTTLSFNTKAIHGRLFYVFCINSALANLRHLLTYVLSFSF